LNFKKSTIATVFIYSKAFQEDLSKTKRSLQPSNEKKPVFVNISQFYLSGLDGRIRVNDHIVEVRITLAHI
jgi:hypothetical protein